MIKTYRENFGSKKIGRILLYWRKYNNQMVPKET